MEKVVELRIRDVEIVIEEELSEGRNANKASKVVVDMPKCFIRLNIFELFAYHFDNSKSFEYFHNEGDEVTLDLG
jgi:hypothetical protein